MGDLSIKSLGLYFCFHMCKSNVKGVMNVGCNCKSMDDLQFLAHRVDGQPEQTGKETLWWTNMDSWQLNYILNAALTNRAFSIFYWQDI